MSVFTGELTSMVLGKNVTVRVIFPDSPYDLPQLDTKPKTMYLLHGYTGSSGDWLRFTQIEEFARKYNFHIVMADAENSMYSDMAYGPDYPRFFTEELPAIVNGYCKLSKQTFICGQSMGGYGAIKLGLSHPEKYLAIGVFSAGITIGTLSDHDPHLHLTSMDKAQMAVFSKDRVHSEKDDVYALAEKVLSAPKQPPIISYCGNGDFVFEANNSFSAHLEKIGYPHEYYVTEGAHLWDYWNLKMPEMMGRLCQFAEEEE